MSTAKNAKSEMIRIRMPHEIMEVLRKKNNYSEWIKIAIKEKLDREKKES